MCLYTIGMHHQDASIHPWLRKLSNPWHAGPECPIVATEAFRLAIVHETHRNISNSDCCYPPFRWAKLYNGPRSASGLGKSLIDQLKCVCRASGHLASKHGDGFTRSLFSERAVTQTVDDDRAQTLRRLDNFPRVSTDFLALNSNADPAAFESMRVEQLLRDAQPCPNRGSMPRLTKHLEPVRKTFDRAKASTRSTGG